jgi:hypothetical protein
MYPPVSSRFTVHYISVPGQGEPDVAHQNIQES